MSTQLWLIWLQRNHALFTSDTQIRFLFMSTIAHYMPMRARPRKHSHSESRGRRMVDAAAQGFGSQQGDEQ